MTYREVPTARILELHAAGVKYSAIARELGVGRQLVRYRLMAAGAITCGSRRPPKRSDVVPANLRADRRPVPAAPRITVVATATCLHCGRGCTETGHLESDRDRYHRAVPS